MPPPHGARARRGEPRSEVRILRPRPRSARCLRLCVRSRSSLFHSPNSLFCENNSLICPKKYPVNFRDRIHLPRHNRSKIKLLRRSKGPGLAQNRQDSLINSLLAGNSPENGSNPTASAAIKSCSSRSPVQISRNPPILPKKRDFSSADSADGQREQMRRAQPAPHSSQQQA